MKRVLSKSQANLFLDCPFKWKKVYIDGIRSEPSPAQDRGIRIHSKIENFYKNAKLEQYPEDDIPQLKNEIDEELVSFTQHENVRLNKCVGEDGKFDIQYFKPVFQELKMQNDELGIKGIVDAVFLNPDDNKLIVMDWKTGRYYPNKFDDYRFELAVYTELLKTSGKIDETPKYWGIYFVDQDKTFFEEVQQDHIDKMYKTMDKVREGINSGTYPPKKNQWCYFCQFKNECEAMQK